jgi:hypothetical protein
MIIADRECFVITKYLTPEYNCIFFIFYFLVVVVLHLNVAAKYKQDGKTALDHAKNVGNTEMKKLLNKEVSLRADQLNGIIRICSLLVAF